MSNVGKHISWNKANHDALLDLLTEFSRLTNSQKREFIKRNGFNPSGYKEFMESSVMVFLTLTMALGDVRYERGRFYIRSDNLKKRYLNKELWDMPANWCFEEWCEKYLSQSNQE